MLATCTCPPLQAAVYPLSAFSLALLELPRVLLMSVPGGGGSEAQPGQGSLQVRVCIPPSLGHYSLPFGP